MSRRTAVVFVGIVGFMSVCSAQTREGTTSQLDVLKGQYAKAVEKAQMEYGATLVDLRSKYVAALDALMQTMTKQGDLDGALAVRAEKEKEKGQATVGVSSATPDAQTRKPTNLTDGIVIWNSHNSGYNDFGARRLNVICLSANREVWRRENVVIEWEPLRDNFAVVDSPSVAFDTVRVEITQHVGHGGSLAEIQVFSRGVNVAEGCAVTASSTYEGNYGATQLTDGVTTSERNAEGYWVSRSEPKSWVAVDLGKKRKEQK